MHPEDRLPDYVLGWLDPSEQREIETHLASCAQCRAEVRALREGLSALAETLPTERPNPRVWANIQARLAREDSEVASPELMFPAPRDLAPIRPDAGASLPARRGSWLPLGLAASVALLAASLLWGANLSQQRQRLDADQTAIESWLTDPTVGVKYLREPGEPVRATALVRIDGTALVVLPAAAPAGKTFQIWGIGKNEAGIRTITAIGQTQGQAVQVSWQGYGALWLSLEPAGGSPQPTRTLGRARFL